MNQAKGRHVGTRLSDEDWRHYVLLSYVLTGNGDQVQKWLARNVEAALRRKGLLGKDGKLTTKGTSTMQAALSKAAARKNYRRDESCG